MTDNSSKIQNAARSFVIVLFLIACAFGSGLLLGSNARSGSVQMSGSSALPADYSYLERLYGKVQSDYLGTIPGQSELTQSLAKGLIDSLNDPYSAYLNPAEAQDYLKLADNAYDGIGVQLGYKDPYTIVVSPLSDSPGAKAGLKSGDEIIAVDGVDMSKVRPEIVATKIKGVAGTSVTLTIYRESEARMFDTTITREAINMDTISYQDMGEGIYLISIVKFTEGATGDMSGADVFDREWDEIAGEVAALNPKGVIVDLRNNPGGYVQSVRYVAEEFLSDGTVIMSEQRKDETPIVYKDNRAGKFESVPLAVLVNEGSASAAEIFAGSMKDNSRGVVIGQKTFGKGVEQELLPLSDDSLLLLVFRKWLTPNGTQINKDSPITPNEIVEYVAPGLDGIDSQVARALADLKAEIN